AQRPNTETENHTTEVTRPPFAVVFLWRTTMSEEYVVSKFHPTKKVRTSNRHPSKDKAGKTRADQKPTANDTHNEAGQPLDARLRLFNERDNPNVSERKTNG